MDSEKLNPTIDSVVLQLLIQNALKYESIPGVQEKLIDPVLQRLGLSYEWSPDLALDAMTDDFREYLGLEMRSSGFGPGSGKVWHSRPISTAQLSPGADRTLVDWARTDPDEFGIIAGPKQ